MAASNDSISYSLELKNVQIALLLATGQCNGLHKI